jgi:hypothetical protein
VTETGSVLEWQSGTGIKPIAETDLSGANGTKVSKMVDALCSGRRKTARFHKLSKYHERLMFMKFVAVLYFKLREFLRCFTTGVRRAARLLGSSFGCCLHIFFRDQDAGIDHASAGTHRKHDQGIDIHFFDFGKFDH